MIMTEEELRQAWQNGRGQIPAFPAGTRFTPAALDFLRARDLAPAPPVQASPQAAAGRMELQAPPGKRLIYTAADVAGLLASSPGILMVHPSVTLTHAAQERLRGAGVRVIPWIEPPAASPAPPSAPPIPPPAMPTPARVPPGADPALFLRVREAVLARLGRPVDPAVLDAVLQRVLAEL
jgi:hypothetical protein